MLHTKNYLRVVMWMLGFKYDVKGWENIKKAEEMGGVLVMSHVRLVLRTPARIPASDSPASLAVLGT